MYIQLTKYPERAATSGLSTSVGQGVTPTAESEPEALNVLLIFTDGTEQSDYYEDGIIPTGQYIGDTTIKKVKIGTGITTISARAFANCTSLTTAYIGEDVTTIYSSCFAGSSLRRLYMQPTTAPSFADSGCFSGVNSGGIVYYPTGSEDTYLPSDPYDSWYALRVDYYWNFYAVTY